VAELHDPALEWRLRVAVVPAAIVIAIAFHASPMGHFLQRTFLSMLPHELGHAITAWWCGFGAVPGLWRTSIPESRSAITAVLVLAGSGGVGYLGWRTERRALVVIAAVAVAAQALGTLAISATTANTAIIFGGDAGAMVLGTLLMMTFFAPPDHSFVTNQLRWGFVVIGAAAYVDVFATWLTRDIPFGLIEGVGESDPSRLVGDSGWSVGELVRRYDTVGVICGVALAVVYALGVRAARRADPALQ
jgi:hypothetical protein